MYHRVREEVFDGILTAALVVSLSFGILVTNSDVRAAVADAVVTWYEKYIEIDFGKSPAVDDTEIADFESLNIGYIPDGFELTSSNVNESVREYAYTADNGDYIFIGLYSSEHTQFAANIEGVEYEEMTINNNDAYVMYNEAERLGMAVIGNSKYTVSITLISEKSELIKIAENIK